MAARRRVAITGTTGQLGRALVAANSGSWDILAINRSDTDLSDWSTVRDRIVGFAPDLVIHAAAATDVDGCERDPAMAFLGNALATRHVARAAAACDAQLVYISTNFVFDGGKSDPYHEFDAPAPISVYGASKLAGEVEARAATKRCFVVRTSMVFAPEGRNFVLTMRRLMAERDRLTVVDDQFGNPTYAPDLASAIVALIDRAPFGTYHVTNAGSASWHSWACEIAAVTGATSAIEPIPAASYRRDATPPANGILQSLTLPQLGIELPDWRDALRRCLST
ncbi:MAG: dTDP-4-dehydrorhamnose reductase [Chloroflexota bacterium]|nr:dTDP-4-dehydrorhamnose reductase [Chloroflexota bacterium]